MRKLRDKATASLCCCVTIRAFSPATCDDETAARAGCYSISDERTETVTVNPEQSEQRPTDFSSLLQSLNGRLLFAIIASAFGSAFQHGYNTGVVNAPQTLIETWIGNVLSDRNDGKAADKSQVTLIWAVAVAIFCFGGMIGGLCTGVVADKFGRKGGLLVSNALVVVSAALQGKQN
ncbi:solute carrier family 2, facilitated glucose transporter member 1-like, partial [Aphis craccivora]